MDLLLAIILFLVGAALGFLVGGSTGYNEGWKSGRNYTLEIYDPHQLEYERKLIQRMKYHRRIF